MLRKTGKGCSPFSLLDISHSIRKVTMNSFIPLRLFSEVFIILFHSLIDISGG